MRENKELPMWAAPLCFVKAIAPSGLQWTDSRLSGPPKKKTAAAIRLNSLEDGFDPAREGLKMSA